MVNFRPRPLYHRERIPIPIELEAAVGEEGVVHGAYSDDLEERKISCVYWDSNPGPFVA